MTNRERYEQLKQRESLLKQEIARREGERQVFVKKLKDMGFSSKAEAEKYLKEKKVECEQQNQLIEKRLDEYESSLNKIEKDLEDCHG